MSLKVGDPAPDFELDSTNGKTVRLSDFIGKKNVLLCFYPLDFTPVCTSQNCSFSQDHMAFRQYDTEVLPISTDSKFCHNAFREKYNMGHHLLSDIQRDATRKYDLLFEPFNCSRRAYFLIGKDGLVKWMHVEEDLKESRSVAELMSIVKTAVG